MVNRTYTNDSDLKANSYLVIKKIKTTLHHDNGFFFRFH